MPALLRMPTLAAVILLLLPVPPHAAEAPPDTLTLQEALAATLQHNPELAAHAVQRKVLAADKQTAALRPGYNLNTQLEDVGGSDDYRWAKSAELTLSLSSQLELGSKREARIGVASAREQELASAQRVMALDLLAAVTQQYLAVLALQEQESLQERAQVQLRQTREVLARQVDAGRTADIELLRADAALAQAELARQATRRLLGSERIRLSAWWGETAPAFTRVQGNLLELPAPLSRNELLLNLAANPDLAALAGQSLRQAAELREAEAQQAPNLQWNTGLRRLQGSGDMAFVLGLSLPLGTRERASGQIAAALAGQELLELRADALRVQLQARALSLYEAYDAARAEVLALQGEVLPLLESALAASEAAFAQGAYGYLELQLAQRQLLDAQQSLLATAARAHLLAVDLERLSGAALAAAAGTPDPLESP